MPGPRDPLSDIVDICDRVAEALSGITRDRFLGDPILQDATAYRVMAVGEAMRSVPPDVRARRPEIAWREAVAMRNKLAHDYLDYDAEIVWLTATRDLPLIASVCREEQRR